MNTLAPRIALNTVLATAVLFLAAGCASTRLDAQWADPQLAPGLLRGAKVMVACEAYEPVVKRLCLDQMASELTARGASPVLAADVPNSTPGRPVPADQLLGAARLAGAKAVWSTTMQIADQSAGSGFSVGLGGFGGGSHVGGGVGVTLPVGGGQGRNGYAANGTLTDVASGRMLWTAKASAPPSSDVSAQVGELARTVLGAADKAGLF
ncbi:hypothetical protein [Ideonella sp. BN130291]|uniref:hypothetical protein n=1 Tax=Ideonella sp. BN130291 TaxID=3112940 RepID=UPI002E25F181|nr:hypothetical protein [Ideonella sp. BN130291]